MKALTLRQPWATLIAIGAKRIETRRWHPAENPGVIAIASSKSPMSAAWRDRCNQPPFSGVLPYDAENGRVKCPIGHIVAVARIGECLPTEAVGADELEREGDFGDFSDGRWAWFLSEVVPLYSPIRLPSYKPGEKKPFRLTLWDVPQKIVTPELTRVAAEVATR